ncbi:sigma-70 family RNA polymerase sigma factor [Leptobacterium flavescens]|uniref:Sigma-70 family RNA polymerase sigma factor n=1 Tax=Leptobacterium flavescens TaxID=472055 RepID=A0A6P0USI5_9FLAO|nr:RNA polymerase sigma factor [Leptobacterium flavescens]NER14948.1 sigma-70 family RNA polymerase sigma factor [Leptobacterium flavescens]
MEKEFGEIYNSHHQKVYRLCMGYFKGNTSLADEVSQEVFIKIWEKLRSFRGESEISTWIYRITVNTCLMHIRSANKKKEVHLEFVPDSVEENPEGEKEEQLKMLYSCIYKLNELNRISILMVLEGVPYERIAEVTGLSEDTLRVRIHRIKKSLTQCVKKING